MTRFTKATAKKEGQKGGKTTHKRYGKAYMAMLGRKRWAVYKSDLTKKASGSILKV